MSNSWKATNSVSLVTNTAHFTFGCGVLSRRSIEMNRDKVESVVIDQSLTGRLLDFGTVVIRGVGAGLEPVANVVAPLEFRRQVGFE